MNLIFSGRNNKNNIKGELYKSKIKIFKKNIDNKIIIEKNAILKNCKIRIKGNNNLIIIKENTKLVNCKLDIKEYGNKLILEKNCSFKNLNIVFHNINSNIFINKNTTCEGMKLISTEPFDIEIGENCMFSYGIEIRNSDSHKIFSMINDKRINGGAKIIIENDVWIGTRCLILKGSFIEQGSVLGAGSIVTGRVEKNSIYAGVPAKKIKSEIYWEK
ncbi:acyltransferase [Fusobacterium varium]|uniref:acyltransferase n=1 Tax=Fusobacterium varium TaxID=856 RepID=UPI0032C09A27